MLAQDPFTGYVHEIPDRQVQGYGQVLYDGLGNPVGWSPIDMIKSVVSNIPIVGGLVSNLLPGSTPPAQVAVQAPPIPVPVAAGVPVPPIPIAGPIGQLLPNVLPASMPGYPSRRCQTPVGWTTPALPYTGTAPRRLYLRCSVWPGQAGLVPVQPGQWPQAQAPQAAAMGRGRSRRHFRRRR